MDDRPLDSALRAIWYNLVKSPSKYAIDLNELSYAFNRELTLSEAVQALGFLGVEGVYVCWDWAFEFVYEFKFTDVSDLLDDFWYPGPDDLLIISLDQKMALGLTHYGVLCSLRLGEPIPPDPKFVSEMPPKAN